MRIRGLILTLILSAASWAAAPPQAPASSEAASAGVNVIGSVLNSTTGKALPRAQVTLIQLQGGMQPVATTVTDAAGRFRFSQSTPGPYMVESDYQGVRYFAQVTQGQSETNVQVYDASSDVSRMLLDAEIMVLQPDAGQLAVVNEYRVDNSQQPPRTLSQPKGIFRFRVPAGAQVDMVRVVGPSQMPISLEPTPTADHDVYGVDAALRPGETRIQVSYRIPYAGLKALVSETPVVSPAHFEVYVPSPMTFQGDGFTQVGEQDGYRVYGIPDGPVPQTVSFNVAGDAPMPNLPQAAGNDQANAPPDASSAASAESSAPAAAVGAIPAPTFMERNRWTILAILGLAAAAGFGMLLARPQPEPVPVVTLVDAPGGLPGASAVSAALPAAAPAALPAAPDLASELSRLKDDLFLLEVQHHTGRLSEGEYARQRAAIHARMDRLAGRR